VGFFIVVFFIKVQKKAKSGQKSLLFADFRGFLGKN
jgi:hypothetical protein